MSSGSAADASLRTDRQTDPWLYVKDVPFLLIGNEKIVGLLGRGMSQQGNNVERSSQLNSFRCFIYKTVLLVRKTSG